MIGHNKHQNDNPQPHNLQPVTLSPLNIKHASAFTRLAAAQAAYHHLHSYGVKYSPVLAVHLRLDSCSTSVQYLCT